MQKKPKTPKKTSKKQAVPKPIIIKLSAKHKKQARESLRKHKKATFEIRQAGVRSLPARVITSTVHG